MARTPSNMLPLGFKLPNASLLNTLNFQQTDIYKFVDGQPVLLMFICNHCPFVIHLHQGLVDLYKDYKDKDVKFIAVSANDADVYVEDAPDKMKLLFDELGLDFPYLHDETQAFAKALDAACTPDFYFFDSSKVLVYRGRFDESRPGNGIPVTGEDIRQTLDNLLSDRPISEFQKPSLGCNIKWKE
jgi:thiol-disulfide isomerase/thioredoxin